jgi:hypothetical protein
MVMNAPRRLPGRADGPLPGGPRCTLERHHLACVATLNPNGSPPSSPRGVAASCRGRRWHHGLPNGGSIPRSERRSTRRPPPSLAHREIRSPLVVRPAAKTGASRSATPLPSPCFAVHGVVRHWKAGADSTVPIGRLPEFVGPTTGRGWEALSVRGDKLSQCLTRCQPAEHPSPAPARRFHALSGLDSEIDARCSTPGSGGCEPTRAIDQPGLKPGRLAAQDPR